MDPKIRFDRCRTLWFDEYRTKGGGADQTDRTRHLVHPPARSLTSEVTAMLHPTALALVANDRMRVAQQRATHRRTLRSLRRRLQIVA
jgi:hypothetical protein